MKHKDGLIVAAALAGLVAIASPALAKNSKKAKGASDTVKCYGVNKCAGHNKCGGADHACAGKNACKGKGWLYMPKESCDNIEGGTTVAPTSNKADTKKKPKKEMGSH